MDTNQMEIAMDVTPSEIAVNITHTESSQQSNIIPNHIAYNSKDRSIKIDTSLFATLAVAAQNDSHFSQIDWRLSKLDEIPKLSKKHVSCKISEFVALGLISKKENKPGHYDLTDLGKILHDKGFKYHLSRIIDMKRRGEEEVKKYLRSMSDGTLFQSGKQSGKLFSACSYIEERKNELINISQSLFGSYVSHLSLSPEERMLKNIKKRNSDIEEVELKTIFSMIRRNIKFIKDKRWFDQFDQCVKAAIKLLNECKDKWGKDGADIFSTAWGTNHTKWFTNANQISRAMRQRLGFDFEDKATEYTEQQWLDFNRTDHFDHIPREVLV